MKTPEIYSDGQIAERLAAFEKIRHRHALLDVIHREINGVRAEVRQVRHELRERLAAHPKQKIKRDPLPIITIIGPSGTAKSHVIKSYMEDFVAKEKWDDDRRLVIDFELSVDANKRQLQVDTLTAFNDPDPEKGNESVLRRRVAKLVSAKETELSFTDEVQHFITSDTQKRTRSVGDAIKKNSNAGIFAQVLLGTEKASFILEANPELAQRVVRSFDLRGANLEDRREREMFVAFLKTFRDEIESRGILRSAKILETPETIGLLSEQVAGQFGTVVRVLKSTVRVSLQKGATSLLPSHFATAIARGQFTTGKRINWFEKYADSLAGQMSEMNPV